MRKSPIIFQLLLKVVTLNDLEPYNGPQCLQQYRSRKILVLALYDS